MWYARQGTAKKKCDQFTTGGIIVTIVIRNLAKRQVFNLI